MGSARENVFNHGRHGEHGRDFEKSLTKAEAKRAVRLLIEGIDELRSITNFYSVGLLAASGMAFSTALRNSVLADDYLCRRFGDDVGIRYRANFSRSSSASVYALYRTVHCSLDVAYFTFLSGRVDDVLADRFSYLFFWNIALCVCKHPEKNDVGGADFCVYGLFHGDSCTSTAEPWVWIWSPARNLVMAS